MHEKTAVSSLIEEIYTFLKQADTRELTHLFRDLDKAKAKNDKVKMAEIMSKIDNFETHVVPMICDIDAGFGNEEATYQLAKKMIEAGACCIQMENQVSVFTRRKKYFAQNLNFFLEIINLKSFLRFQMLNNAVIKMAK